MPHQAQDMHAGTNVNLMGEIIKALGRGLCLSVEVFLHRSFGSAYVSSGVAAFVLMFLFTVFIPLANPQPMMVFASFYGVLWLFAVLNVLIRRLRKKEYVHSEYSGRPYLCRLLPSWKESSVKHLESLVVLLIAYGIHAVTRTLGDYLLVAGIFVLLRSYGIAVAKRQRAVEMNDAVIEQREVAEAFRQMQQD